MSGATFVSADTRRKMGKEMLVPLCRNSNACLSGWLYPREIFQLEDVQSSGKSTRAANMLFTFIVTQTFLRILCVMKFGSFIFLAFLVVMTLYCYYFMEETENIAIE
ncbi:UNVERIFIED_CONTAM: Sugar transport protein 12 [Sesamum angustifolium]|uniref:Sugar transport protein 12 n=1 Tax=Sesamum angustifolium TaxID=2727405 RepID=A0AAW2N6V1_9LAMI